MSEANKALVRRLYEEVYNQENLDVVDELCAPNFISHMPYVSQPTPGPAGWKQAIVQWHRAFPDTHQTLETMIAEGDTVAVRWTFRGTHRGTFLGIAPTGRQMTTTGISCFRLANGKIVEEWIEWDSLGMAQQLGAVPSDRFKAA